MSMRLLVDLLEYTGPVLATLMEGAALESDATFPVAWAGQQRSPMWLDIGRELTERWHHQDQIREAVGAEPIGTPEMLRAVIAVSLFALPGALHRVARPDGTRVAITARGPAGGTWHVERRAGMWRQVEETPLLPPPHASRRRTWIWRVCCCTVSARGRRRSGCSSTATSSWRPR